jgi:hypothetical protein
MAYTKAQKESIFDKVLDYISNGMSLNTALKQDDTFSKVIWLDLIKDEDKKTRYTCAREERADFIFEEILAIADNSGNDRKIIKDGEEVINHEAIQRDRLRVDARKWVASKMNPKKYGDKTEVEHSGEINTKIIPLTPQRAKEIDEALENGC